MREKWRDEEEEEEERNTTYITRHNPRHIPLPEHGRVPEYGLQDGETREGADERPDADCELAFCRWSRGGAVAKEMAEGEGEAGEAVRGGWW